MTTRTLESDNDGTVSKSPSEPGCRETHSASVSGASPCKAFDGWWSDQSNGCPTLVFDNDEEFARAVWKAAISSIC